MSWSTPGYHEWDRLTSALRAERDEARAERDTAIRERDMFARQVESLLAEIRAMRERAAR